MRLVKVFLFTVTFASASQASDLSILGSELAQEDSNLVQILEVRNDGFRHLKPVLWVDVYDSLRNHVGRFRSKRQVAFANATVFFRISLKGLKEGSYTGLVVGQYVASTSSKNIDDSITLLGTLQPFSLPLAKPVAGNVIQRDKSTQVSSSVYFRTNNLAVRAGRVLSLAPIYAGERTAATGISIGRVVRGLMGHKGYEYQLKEREKFAAC